MKTNQVIIGKTLAGDIVIVHDNGERYKPQLAEFNDQTASALARKTAALAAVSFADSLGASVVVERSLGAAYESMISWVLKAVKALDLEVEETREREVLRRKA